jgi:glycosyltransferase involved in cell wall biosynthesis
MKIIIATPLYQPEIAEPAPYVKKLAENLKNDHKITVIAYTNNKEEIPGTRLIAIQKNQPIVLRLIKYTFELSKASRDANVIYVPNGIASSLPAIIVSILNKTPIIIKFTGDEAWERSIQLGLTSQSLEDFLVKPKVSFKILLIMVLQGFILRQSKFITTSSNYLKKSISKAYKIDNKKIIINYNPAPKKETLPFPTEKNPNKIFTSTEFATKEDIKNTIRAIKKTGGDLKLIITGKLKDEKELRGFSRELEIEKQIIFLGDVSKAENWYELKTSALQIINRNKKNEPDIVLKGFMAKTPTIATNVEGINEAVINGESGIIVETNNSDKIAKEIKKVLNDESLVKSLIAGGEKVIFEKFSWKNHLKTINKILTGIK